MLSSARGCFDSANSHAQWCTRGAWCGSHEKFEVASPTFRRHLAGMVPSQPLARDLISLASLSISSAFRTMARESTLAESVFSTSAFNSLASS